MSRQSRDPSSTLSPFLPDNIAFEKLDGSGFIEIARSQINDRLRSVFLGRDELIPVQFEKKYSDNKADSLVAIDEWMVLDYAGRVGGGHRDQVRPFSVCELLLRKGNCRSQ